MNKNPKIGAHIWLDRSPVETIRLILCLSWAVAAPASAAVPEAARDQPPELVAAITTGSPPFHRLDETGKTAGFAIDAIEQIARLAGGGIKRQMQDSRSTSLEALGGGRVDLRPDMGTSKHRARGFLFTSPIATHGVSLFTRAAKFRQLSMKWFGEETPFWTVGRIMW